MLLTCSINADCYVITCYAVGILTLINASLTHSRRPTRHQRRHPTGVDVDCMGDDDTAAHAAVVDWQSAAGRRTVRQWNPVVQPVDGSVGRRLETGRVDSRSASLSTGDSSTTSTRDALERERLTMTYGQEPVRWIDYGNGSCNEATETDTFREW